MERIDKAPAKGSKVTEKEYERIKGMVELGLSNTLASKLSFRSQSVVSCVRHSENYEDYVHKSRTRLRKKTSKTKKATVTAGTSMEQLPVERLKALKDLGVPVEATPEVTVTEPKQSQEQAMSDIRIEELLEQIVQSNKRIVGLLESQVNRKRGLFS